MFTFLWGSFFFTSPPSPRMTILIPTQTFRWGLRGVGVFSLGGRVGGRGRGCCPRREEKRATFGALSVVGPKSGGQKEKRSIYLFFLTYQHRTCCAESRVCRSLGVYANRDATFLSESNQVVLCVFLLDRTVLMSYARPLLCFARLRIVGLPIVPVGPGVTCRFDVSVWVVGTPPRKNGTLSRCLWQPFSIVPQG